MMPAVELHLTMQPAISVGMPASTEQVCSLSPKEHSTAILLHTAASTVDSRVSSVCGMPAVINNLAFRFSASFTGLEMHK